jgi:hypothetical protein
MEYRAGQGTARAGRWRRQSTHQLGPGSCADKFPRFSSNLAPAHCNSCKLYLSTLSPLLEREKHSSSNEACISEERVRVIIACTGALQDSDSLVEDSLEEVRPTETFFGRGEVSVPIRRFCCMRSFSMRLITSA